MKVYHWYGAGIDLLVMSETEEAARLACSEQCDSLSVYEPERAKKLREIVEKAPFYEAPEDHVIAIRDSSAAMSKADYNKIIAEDGATLKKMQAKRSKQAKEQR
jgi:hypothetical protein